jgi:hypothetical protein
MRRELFLFCASVAACIAAGCAPGGTQDASITGSVVAAIDAPAPSPVAGAVCTLEGTHQSAVTAADGSFAIRHVEPGTYLILCMRTTADGRTFAVLQVADVPRTGHVALGVLTATAPGTIAGTVTVAGGSPDGVAIAIPGTSFAAHAAHDGSFALTDVPEGTYALRYERAGYRAVDVPGVVVQALTTTTVAPVALALSTGPTGSLTFPDATVAPNGQVVSTTATVRVAIASSDDAVLMQVSDDPQFVGVAWQPVAAERSWTFRGNGLWHLYARFADANGLASTPNVATLAIDPNPPVTTSGSGSYVGGVVDASNHSATITRFTSVRLIFGVRDDETTVAGLRIGYLPDFSDAVNVPFTFGPPDSRLGGQVVPWTLPGEGVYTIYARFTDLAGNVSAPFTVPVTVDTTPPVMTLTVAGPGPAGYGTTSFAYSVASSEVITLASGSAACGRLIVSSTQSVPLQCLGFVGGATAFGSARVDPLAAAVPPGTYPFTLDFVDRAGNLATTAPAMLTVPTM